MRILLGCLILLCLAFSSEAKEFKLYAALLQETPVELADGSKWVMDKGDVFPVLMYKDMQTKIILQLAGTSFRTETTKVRLIAPSEIEAGMANYRRNVENYLETQSEKARAKLSSPSGTR